MTLLHVALQMGAPSVVIDRMLEVCKSSKSHQLNNVMEAEDDKGCLPLHVACMYWNYGIDDVERLDILHTLIREFPPGMFALGGVPNPQTPIQFLMDLEDAEPGVETMGLLECIALLDTAMSVAQYFGSHDSRCTC
jgi:hypothetical protein